MPSVTYSQATIEGLSDGAASRIGCLQNEFFGDDPTVCYLSFSNQCFENYGSSITEPQKIFCAKEDWGFWREARAYALSERPANWREIVRLDNYDEASANWVISVLDDDEMLSELTAICNDPRARSEDYLMCVGETALSAAYQMMFSFRSDPVVK